MKKHLKRALSLVLALTLVVTSFLIFDPDLLRVESDAYVNVETAQTSSFLASQTFYATETIYLKPGSNDFQYYENFNYSSGTVSSPVDTSGQIYFRNEDATKVEVYVNNFYRKGGSQVPVNSLKINSTTVAEYAGMTNGSATRSKGTLIASANVGELDFPVTAGSAAGLVEGGVYIIEWVVAYTIGDAVHYAFAYTGIYVQPLGQAGITYAVRHSEGDAEQHGYSFVTGVHKIGGGNSKSKLINKTHNGNGSLAAPLVAFSGYVNNANSYTFYGGNTDYRQGGNLFSAQSQGGVATQTMTVKDMDGGDQVQKDAYFVTKTAANSSGLISTPGTYENPATSGTIYREADNAENHTTGVGYILVDSSRYNNYNQIPYLSVGWAQLYAYDATEDCKLNWIVCMDHEQTEYNQGQRVSLNGFNVNVDTTATTGKELYSMTRGLYKINGPIPNPTAVNGVKSDFMQIVFSAYVDRNRTLNDHKIQVYSNVGLHTTVTNQNMLRQQYNKALCSYVDYQNIQTYASDMNYANYYNYVKTAGEELADPTAYSRESYAELETFVNNCVNKMAAVAAPEVFFYVPEVIYLNPIASNGHYDFQYYVDRESKNNGALTRDGKDIYGDVYFSGTNAVEVVDIRCEIMQEYAPQGQTLSITLGGTSSATGTIGTTITSGYLTTYTTTYLEWTATYKNRAGQELEATAFTCCYALPNPLQSANSAISATARTHKRGSLSGFSYNRYIITISSWILGAHSVDYNGYNPSSGASSNTDNQNGINWDYAGSYKIGFDTRSTVPTGGGSGGADEHNFGNMYESGTGGSAWYADGDSIYTTGGYGTITVDSSRYTNMGQIPNLIVGADCNYKNEPNSFSRAKTLNLYYDWYNNSSNNTQTTANSAISTQTLEQGTRFEGSLANAVVTPKSSDTKTLVLHGKGYFDRDGDHVRTASATCYLGVNFRDKSALREAYENVVKKTQYLQEEYFTQAEWKKFTDLFHIPVLAELLNPEASSIQATINANALALNNQVNRMVAAVTATGDTFNYETRDANGNTSPVTNADRTQVIRRGTVNVHHIVFTGSQDGATQQLLPTETEQYYLGETINTGYNETPGYNYFGFYRSEGTDVWDGTFSKLKGDMAAQGAYGDSGHNTDLFYKGETLTYTYVYTPEREGVYLDYGEADSAFENKQNLANVLGATADFSYTGDETFGGIAEGELTDNGFDFAVQGGGVGYNINTPVQTGINNLFNFQTWGWNNGDVDYANETFTMTKDNTNSTEKTTSFGGASRGIRGVEGHNFRVMFDYKNTDTTTQGVTVNVMWFTYAPTDSAFSDWGGKEDRVRAGRTQQAIAPGESGTYSVDIDPPAGYANLSLRFEIHTANATDTVAPIEFSNIRVYDISEPTQYAKMNDFFLKNVATGLTPGKYTVSFESSLQYDDYRFWAMDMYGQPNPGLDWSHNYGSIQMFMSTTKDGDDLYNYTVPIRVTTDISAGGTIGVFEVPEGCSNINLGFCVTSDQPLTGWVRNIKIAQGEYVQTGRNNQTITLLEPSWEGYTFTGWGEGRQPFNGTIVQPKTFTFGSDSDTVLAQWRINKYDVTFDNELDFDATNWNPENRSYITVDYDDNTLNMVAPDSDENFGPWNGIECLQLEPGHTYRVSYDYVKNNSVNGDLHSYVFGDNNEFSVNSRITMSDSGTHSYTFTVPEDESGIIRLRLGLRAAGADVTFSDIYVQDITRGPITESNLFDFDSWNWTFRNASNGSHSDTNKTVTFTATSSDSSTANYEGSTANKMLLEEGHTYRLSYKAVNGNVSGYSSVRLNPYLFFYPNANTSSAEWTMDNSRVIDIGSEGTHTIDFTVPTGKPYLSFRLAINTSGATVTFSNITLKDITLGDTLVDDMSVSEPHVTVEEDGVEIIGAVHGVVRTYQEVLCNDIDLLALPSITSELYDFEGWYTEKYGKGERVTADRITSAGTNNHFSHWTVSLNYVIGRDAAYKDSAKAPQAQTGKAIGTTITIGSYVPYSEGKNFAGWQASVYNPETKQLETKVFLPGEQVQLIHNIRLSPVWDDAPVVNKDTDYTECSKLYPGQVYFYRYTPAKNEYVSAYVYGGTQNVIMDVYVDNAVVSSGSTDYSYGIQNLNSLASHGLSANTEHYFGISSGSDSIVTSDAKFRITEHYVNYSLSTAGGTVANGNEPVLGYYNTDTALETPVRPGYSFLSWDYSTYSFTDKVPAASNSEIIKNNKTSFITNAELVAQWSINSYELTAYAYFNHAEGAGQVSDNYLHGSSGGTVSVDNGSVRETGATATVEVEFEKFAEYEATPVTGYTFTGWYKKPTVNGNEITDWGSMFSSERKVTISNMDDEDLTVYARFDIASYDITLYAYSNTNTPTGLTTYENSTVGGTVGFTVDAGQSSVTANYVHGQQFTMYATAKPGYAFSGWYRDDNPITNATPNYSTVSAVVTVTQANSYIAKFSIQKFTITLNANGGDLNGGESSYENYMGLAQQLINPVRAGYTFKGWNLAAYEGGNAFGSLTGQVYTFGAGHDLATAQWALNNYPITVNPNGGIVSINYWRASGEVGVSSSQITMEDIRSAEIFDMAYDTEANLFEPTRQGYTFDGWEVTNSTGSYTEGQAGLPSVYKVGINDAAVITANWKVNQYPLNVYAWGNNVSAEDAYTTGGGQVKIGEDGTLGLAANKLIDYESTAKIYAEPATGYHFVGWQKTQPSTAEMKDIISSYNPFVTDQQPAVPQDYYAVFELDKHTINLSAAYNSPENENTYTTGETGGIVGFQSGSQGATATGTYSYGTSIVITAQHKTGYEFIGWFESVDAQSAIYTQVAHSMNVTEDVSLVAKFKIQQYGITASVQSNTASNLTVYRDNQDAGTVEGTGLYYYDTYTDITATAATGYEFKGWYRDSTLATLETTDPHLVVKVGGGKWYYAKFDVLQGVVHAYAMSNTSDALTTYTNSSVGGTVSFDRDSYAEHVQANPYYYGTYTVYARPATGYKFGGWYLDSALTTEAPKNEGYEESTGTHYNTFTFTGIENGEVVYAKFTVDMYKLEVFAMSNTGDNPNFANNSTGGSVSIEGEFTSGVVDTDKQYAYANVYYGKSATLVANAGTGYIFGGWFVDDKLTTPLGGIESAAMTENGLKYYAKFIVGSFEIVYNPNGGLEGSVKSETAYYDTLFNIAPESAPQTRTGFIFRGWSTDSNATEATYFSGGTIPADTIAQWYLAAADAGAGDKTLYAVWTESAFGLNLVSAYGVSGTYYISDLHGTVEIKDGENNKIPVGAAVFPYLKFVPDTGYVLTQWRYSETQPLPSGTLSSITAWGTEGTGQYTMPDKAVNIVAYFDIGSYDADAWAYNNTAANQAGYVNTATGGTVKLGSNGSVASTARSELQIYGQSIQFTATAAKGYEFTGWYGYDFDNTYENPDDAGTFFEDKILISTNNAGNFAVGDDVNGDPRTNHYFARFDIKSWNATVSSRTYNVREDLIYSLTERPGGYPSIDGANKVGIGLTSDTTDSSWLWLEADENEKTLSAVYGVRVYFYAEAATGYNFGGWYSEKDAEYYGEALVEEFNSSYSRIMREADIYLEAKFIPASFTLVLDPSGGVSGNPQEIIVTYNSPFKIESYSIPTYLGKTFLGWADTQEGAVNEAYGRTIDPQIIDTWYNSRVDDIYTIYAKWETAKITITLDKQGGGEGSNTIEVEVGTPLPSVEVPQYEGFVFRGYFSQPSGEGVNYYKADGTPTGWLWQQNTNGTLYALWQCPVLTNIDYNSESGKWIYTYQDKGGSLNSIITEDAITDASQITDKVADDDNLVWWTLKDDELDTNFVEDKIEETKDINLNHYNQVALSNLLNSVTLTDTDDEREKLTQPQANSYVARMAKYMDKDYAENVRSDTFKPTVTIYESNNKLAAIKRETIGNPEDSANGTVYSVPASSDASSYVYADKYSYTYGDAVDYYLYTNSANPVIALELDDGEVAGTVADNRSSYPTRAVISDNSSSASYIDGSAATYMTSAVKAASDVQNAWYSSYIKAGIGTNYDYNAKTVIYLTPEFTSSGVQNEIVYTITPSDDAMVKNVGAADTELSSQDEADRIYSSYNYSAQKEDITVCICYHNSMNGESDEGTPDASGEYMQMYMDQVNLDTYINQLHLFRVSGGASNWEFPTTDDIVYPVDDPTFPFESVRCTLGSFAYVFDATTEETATAYAESGNYEDAKRAIIASISEKASVAEAAIASKFNELNINSSGNGLGFFEIANWSTNFYPKTDSYVYAHLVDRWGNEFNRVWKCFNVDSYPSKIIESEGVGAYSIFEDGGSNINTVTLDGANVEFVLDAYSTYEDGVFSTSGNTVTLSTGEANKTYSLTVTDKATNVSTIEVTTNDDGILTLDVEDARADLSSGAYSFTLNGETVNLYAGTNPLVLDAQMASVTLSGKQTTVTVTTTSEVTKLQLVENGETRTYTRGLSSAQVVENEDGTLTWTIKFALGLGDHEFELRAKSAAGWKETSYSLTTKVVRETVVAPVALKAAYGDEVMVNEKPVIKVSVLEGTQKVRLVNEFGATLTYSRSEERIESVVDGVETWLLPAGAYAVAGDHTVSVFAKYGGAWQANGSKTVTVTVKEAAVGNLAKIYSVEGAPDCVVSGEYVTFNVLTNSETIKIRFNYANTTATYSASNATIVQNADGTKLWTVKVKFFDLGTNDINFSAKSSKGWGESTSFGSIETIAK